ncbi:uncharacterized protein LOC125218757 isoform X4 [Salvia hispanica]|uniref:uncharacterized protein LOC125218757 isoform X4 n=1 Tax=Salvia hispanica TaxID=49212 RepID=UPI0020096EC0|nr:uncharacterized protein LOC125218757 isoform X4 [Salvia hispanica]
MCCALIHFIHAPSNSYQRRDSIGGSNAAAQSFSKSRFVYFCVNCNDVKNLEKFSKGSQGRFHFEVGNSRKSKNCWSWSVVNKFKRGGEEVHRFREC